MFKHFRKLRKLKLKGDYYKPSLVEKKWCFVFTELGTLLGRYPIRTVRRLGIKERQWRCEDEVS
jgi:hypothetical protein